ncbi:MAG: ABC transporter permease [Coriobacteriia bacterium]|nr:ABC transporter permease [Coriobacteriia bacterium]
MRIATETGLFFMRKMRENLRQPMWVIANLMTPLLYILLFSPLLANIANPPLSMAGVLNSFVPGILTLLAFSSGMGAGWTMVWELQSGVTERLRVTPASRFAMLLGGVLADIVNFLVPSILVILISLACGFSVHLLGLVILLFLLCLLTAMVSACSSSLGLIFKQISSVAAVVTSLQLPLTLLSGVLLPISLGPLSLRVVAHFNPMYYTVEASRQLAAGTLASSQTLIAFVVIVPLLALALWWATRVYQKAVH